MLRDVNNCTCDDMYAYVLCCVDALMHHMHIHQGYPILTVTRTNDTATANITITGARTRFVVGDDPNPGQFSW